MTKDKRPVTWGLLDPEDILICVRFSIWDCMELAVKMNRPKHTDPFHPEFESYADRQAVVSGTWEKLMTEGWKILPAKVSFDKDTRGSYFWGEII